MKTMFEEIVDVKKIGEKNEKHLQELLTLAQHEKIEKTVKEKNLLLAIDVQNDFMEKGSLGVPGSHQDVIRLTQFMYENVEKIERVAVSLDTHHIKQIFHPYWWVDENGSHPEPYTVISLSDVESGKWKPVERKEESLEYVRKLEEKGNKQLCIWTYHCLEGTFGASLESQFSNMLYFHSYVKKVDPLFITKGENPLSEMYGILRAEYEKEVKMDENLGKELCRYDRILVAGEAKSHCVLESIEQMIELFDGDQSFSKKIHVLTDCMSSIPGFEEQTQKRMNELSKNYGIVLTTTKEINW